MEENLKERVIGWLRQAEKDLENAKKNLEIGAYYVSAFLSQQAAEKALKFLYILEKREAPPKTYNLVFLGEILSVPIEILNHCRELTPHITLSKYPSEDFVPFEIYTESQAKKLIQSAEVILEWVKKRLQRK